MLMVLRGSRSAMDGCVFALEMQAKQASGRRRRPAGRRHVGLLLCLVILTRAEAGGEVRYCLRAEICHLGDFTVVVAIHHAFCKCLPACGGQGSPQKAAVERHYMQEIVTCLVRLSRSTRSSSPPASAAMHQQPPSGVCACLRQFVSVGKLSAGGIITPIGNEKGRDAAVAYVTRDM